MQQSLQQSDGIPAYLVNSVLNGAWKKTNRYTQERMGPGGTKKNSGPDTKKHPIQAPTALPPQHSPSLPVRLCSSAAFNPNWMHGQMKEQRHVFMSERQLHTPPAKSVDTGDDVCCCCCCGRLFIMIGGLGSAFFGFSFFFRPSSRELSESSLLLLESEPWISFRSFLTAR